MDKANEIKELIRQRYADFYRVMKISNDIFEDMCNSGSDEDFVENIFNREVEKICKYIDSITKQPNYIDTNKKTRLVIQDYRGVVCELTMPVVTMITKCEGAKISKVDIDKDNNIEIVTVRCT